MPYTYGVDNMKINNYKIFIREHKSAELLYYEGVLKALLQDIDTWINLDETSTYANIHDNAIHNIDMTGASSNMTIDMSDPLAKIGDVGDVLIIKLTIQQDSYSCTVKDSKEDLYVLDSVNEWLILYSNSDGYEFFSWGSSDGSQQSEYTQIGACDAKPTIKTSQDSSVILSNGDEITTYEKLSISFNDLQISKFNYEFLRSFSNIDVCFYNDTDIQGVLVYGINSNAFLDVTGNELNKVLIEANVKDADIDNRFTLFEQGNFWYDNEDWNDSTSWSD